MTQRKAPMNRRYCLFLLLTIPILAAAEKGKASWRGPDRPVYIVTHNRYAEGFGAGVQTPRFGDLIAIEIYSPEPHPANEGAVYKVGERLPLFMKGQQQGNVRIEKVMQFQCDSSAALVSAEPPFSSSKEIHGASDQGGKRSTSCQQAAPSRRQGSPVCAGIGDRVIPKARRAGATGEGH